MYDVVCWERSSCRMQRVSLVPEFLHVTNLCIEVFDGALAGYGGSECFSTNSASEIIQLEFEE